MPPPVHRAPVEDLPGFRHVVQVSGGRTTHAVLGGSGPTVVLLQGWPFTWRVWRQMATPLAEAGYTVLIPDLREIGDSRRTDSTPAPSCTKVQAAADIHDMVSSLGLGEVRVVGMDVGAMVAYAYAAEHRTQVSHLVLSETVLPGFGLEELMNPATGGYWHFGFHMQLDLADWLTQDKGAQYIAPMLKGTSRGDGLSDRDIADITAHYSSTGGMRGGFTHYATLLQDGRANRAAATRPLEMPVLVLNGEHGLPQEPLLDGARHLATHVSADHVPGAGHTYGCDAPAWTSSRLDDFFRAA